MEQKFDKLGRKIPVFDRSAAAIKGNKTNKEKYGTDYHSRIGAIGGSKRTRGYFGQLKDQGKIEELKTISVQAAKRSAQTRKAKANSHTKNSSNKARKNNNAPISGGR